jgi:phenylalanyl-tRNA synthetase beta chain
MRVPVSWLREYVAFDGSVEELAELLSMSGSEVENIEWMGAPRDSENLARFVVGRVLTRQKHPNADKLSLCTVDVRESNGGVRQIVCGADNFQAGDTVAVSLTGAVLQGGLKLRKAAIRGVESDGMMMSEKELGYEEDSAGIVILPSDWTVGAPLAQYLPVAEAVLEIEVTPNRPDCFSVYGIAREVAAAAGLPLAAPPVTEPPTGGAPAEADIAVEVIDADLCPRYAARVIRGLHIAESPPWLKARLTHAGMRPISNVVDVTNYVMLAVGQPLHAFDRANIEGGRLIVRRAEQGERIVTLDEVERTLDSGDLVIADVRRPLVIAGVFGAVDAEVSHQTVDVVLEAANFNGPNILRTEHRTGIRSEASNRFEKGLDPQLAPWGLAMAARLFHELCGGTVAPGTIDVRGELPVPPRLCLRPQRCDSLLGLPVPAAEQAAILRRLECTVEEGGGELFVTPPSFRSDLEREVDLIEEVGRITGLGLVPETLPARRGAVGGLTVEQKLRRAAYDALAGCGLDEIATYTFISRESLASLGLADDDVRSRPLALANPMSAEQAVMRTTLLPGLLGALHENLTRQKRALQLFEGGHIYLEDDQTVPAPAHAAGGVPVSLPHEPEMVGLALLGPLHPENWTGLGRPTDYYALKGVVERLLAAVGVAGAEFVPAQEPFLHPGKSATLLFGERPAGWLGLLRPDVAARFGVEEGEVYAAELSLEEIFRHTVPVPLFTDLLTFPPASQDLSVVVDVDVPAADVLALVRRAGGKLLHEVYLFDVYEGDQVPPGKRSLALRLTMRSPERTLTDKDIGTVRQRVLSALDKEYGATLRSRE